MRKPPAAEIHFLHKTCEQLPIIKSAFGGSDADGKTIFSRLFQPSGFERGIS